MLLTLALFLIGKPAALAQKKQSPSSETKNAADAVTAQQTFASNCAGCHGLDGKGGERGPDIVTRPNIRELSDAELIQILEKGIPQKAMPSFGYLGGPA